MFACLCLYDLSLSACIAKTHGPDCNAQGQHIALQGPMGQIAMQGQAGQSGLKLTCLLISF